MTYCTWQENPDGCWNTECHEDFEFRADGPEDNGFKFCPFCGREINEERWKDPEDIAGERIDRAYEEKRDNP